MQNYTVGKEFPLERDSDVEGGNQFDDFNSGYP